MSKTSRMRSGQDRLDEMRKDIDHYFEKVNDFLQEKCTNSDLTFSSQFGENFVLILDNSWLTMARYYYQPMENQKVIGVPGPKYFNRLRADEIKIVHNDLGPAIDELLLKIGLLEEFQKFCKPFLSAVPEDILVVRRRPGCFYTAHLKVNPKDWDFGDTREEAIGKFLVGHHPITITEIRYED